MAIRPTGQGQNPFMANNSAFAMDFQRAQQQAHLQRRRQESHDEVYAHEWAHQSAAGAFGGGIHLDVDGNGITVGGHVPISIPALNRQNPSESLAAYRQIRSAALAPHDPSGADVGIAGRVDSLMAMAQEEIHKCAEACCCATNVANALGIPVTPDLILAARNGQIYEGMA